MLSCWRKHLKWLEELYKKKCSILAKLHYFFKFDSEFLPRLNILKLNDQI